MKMPFVRLQQTRDGRPRYQFTLSVPAIAVLLSGLLVSVCWCFYMGYMVGRGQNPEEQMQQITAMLLGAQQQPEAPALALQTDATPPAPTATAAPASTQTPSTPAQQDAGHVPGYPTFPNSNPSGYQGEQQASKQEAAPKASAVAEAEPKEKAPFTFTYRLATVRSQEDARHEQERYDAKGFKASIRRSGKFWALNYTLHGSEQDNKEFLRDLKKSGFGQPMLLSKKKN